MKLALYDYISNAGLVGMSRVFNRMSICAVEVDGLSVTSNSLDGFAKNFLELVMNDMRASEQYQQRMIRSMTYARAAKTDAGFHNVAKEVRARIIEVVGKCKKGNLPDECIAWFIKGAEECKSIKTIAQLEDLQRIADSFVEAIRHPMVDDMLTLNYMRYVMSYLHGQVSFLNPSFKGKKEDYLRKIHDDFVGPAREELQLLEERETIPLEERAQWYKQEAKNKERSPVEKTLLRALQDEEKYGRFVPCMVFPKIPGTLVFEESTLYPFGLSVKNAINMSWNGKGGVPISHTAKLVFFCTVLGMVFFRRWTPETEESHDYFAFVNADLSCIEMNRLNEELRTKKDKDNPFEEMLVGSLWKETNEISEWTLRNLLYVEFTVQKKNVKLNNFHIPKRVAEFLLSSHCTISTIRNERLRNEILSRILHNRDTRSFVHQQLYNMIKQGKVEGGDMRKVLYNLHALRLYRKGEPNVNKEKIESLYRSGVDMRRAYFENKKTHQIPGVSYRLLNTVQTGDKQAFMDAVLRMYVAFKKMIPQHMMQFHYENEVLFQEAAHSFIAGLNGYVKEEQEAQKAEAVAIAE